VSYYQGSNFYPSSAVTVSFEIGTEGTRFSLYPDGLSFNSSRKSYVIDLRGYIQRIVQGDLPNSGLFIAPRKYNTTVERILFNGVNTPNKNKPKLSIVYTVL